MGLGACWFYYRGPARDISYGDGELFFLALTSRSGEEPTYMYMYVCTYVGSDMWLLGGC